MAQKLLNVALFMLLVPFTIFAQSTITLSTCEDAMAISNYPNSDFSEIDEISAFDSIESLPIHNLARSYFKFDMSSIPAGSKIINAKLYLYKIGSPTYARHDHVGNNKLYFEQVTSEWIPSGVNWDNQPSTTAEGRASTGVSTSPNQDYIVDISSLITQIFESTNDGFVMKLREEEQDSTASVCFASQDHANGNKRPKLEITFLPPQVILNDSMIYPLVSVKGSNDNPSKFVDEQTSEYPKTFVDRDWNECYKHAKYVFDLGAYYRENTLLFYDTFAVDWIYLYTGDPSNWKLIDSIETSFGDSFSNEHIWDTLTFCDTTRFIMLEFASPQSRVNEITLHAILYDSSSTVLSADTGSVIGPSVMNKLMGINGFNADPDSILSVAGSIRLYYNWSYADGGTDTAQNRYYYPFCSSYQGYPMNKYSFNPDWDQRHLDDDFAKFCNSGLEINACLQTSAHYIRPGFNENAKPIFIGSDSTNPESYRAHADYLFQFAARFGRTQVNNGLLRLESSTSACNGNNLSQINKTGLGFVSSIENWNEEDKWWLTKAEYFSPFEMAAMSSADYDGHERSMGDTVGVKNADPTMKFVLGGLAKLDLNYIRNMKLWSDYNRKVTHKFPADVLNFHHYSNAGGETGPIYGISPEQDSLKFKLKQIVDYRDRYLPGLEIWLSEFGYDSDSLSVQRTPIINGLTREEVQGRWLVRSFLEIAASGINRAHWYLSQDCYSEGDEAHTLYNTSGLVKDNAYSNPDTHLPWHNHNSFDKKPSWYYMYIMKNALTNYSFYRENLSGNSDINIYEFKTPNSDSTIYAVWCTSDTNKVVNNFPIFIGSSSLDTVSLITPLNYSKNPSITMLSQSNDTVYVQVTELPIFILKSNIDTLGRVFALPKKTYNVYLDIEGQSTLNADDVDSASYSTHGTIVSKSLSKSSFTCSDLVNSSSIVINSDSTWIKSSIEDEVSDWSNSWNGVSGNYPSDGTFSLPVEVGQPYSYVGIDSVDTETRVIKTGSAYTYFRKTFELPTIADKNVRIQMTVDDNMEIYINGHMIAREGTWDVANFDDIIPHDLFILADGTVYNGYRGNQSFDTVASLTPDDFIHDGENNITLALRNGGNLGGFSFKMVIGSEGQIPVRYSVSDNWNNENSELVWIKILDTLPPIALAKSITIQLDVEGNGYVSATDIDDGSVSSACESIERMYVTDSIFGCADKPDGHNVYLTVVDSKGDSSITSAIVYVNDPYFFCEEPPSISSTDETSRKTHYTTVYPNPIQNFIKIIQTYNDVVPVQIRLSDVTGKLLLEKNEFSSSGIKEFNIEVCDFTNGAYFLSVKIGDSIKFFKVIKQ